MFKLLIFVVLIIIPGIIAHIFTKKTLSKTVGLSEEESIAKLYWVRRKVNLILWTFIILCVVCLFIFDIYNTLGEVMRTYFGLNFIKQKFLFLFVPISFLLVICISGTLFIQSALYKIDSIIRKTTWSLKEYNLTILRGLALVIFPIIIWHIVYLGYLPDDASVIYAVIFLFYLVMYASYPIIIKLIYKTEKIENPEISEKLIRLCNKANIRCKGIYVLKMPGGKIANALISGLFPFCRYIFLTDFMLEKFTADEIEAILAHEVGHIKNKHLWGYLSFSIIYVLITPYVIHYILILSGKYIEFSFQIVVLSILLWIILYFGIIFGFLSRIFEKQADRYAVEIMGKKDVFISAINKLAKLNYIPKKWAKTEIMPTHPSIERRIKNVENL